MTDLRDQPRAGAAPDLANAAAQPGPDAGGRVACSPGRLEEPPAWVWEVVGGRGVAAARPAVTGSGRLRVVSGLIAGARDMNASDLRQATAALYGEIRRAIAASPTRFPVRFWNMLPHIQEPMGGELDRYMAFNLGRHDAFRDWAGGADRLAGVVPTATGVGHHGGDLYVYALCAERPAAPVENPRQRPAWRYSERFGPAPPCFARAGRVELGDDRVALFVGGTASVRGEDSYAPGDLDAQLEETFLNLDAVIEAGMGPAGSGSNATGGPGALAGASLLTEARAYCLREAEIPAIERAVRARCTGLVRLELCRADICRRELRVEIEGLVVARRTPHGAEALPDAVAVLRDALA